MNAIMDHPRSRGVYDDATPAYSLACGSSPLARGLLTWTLDEVERSRIIPARAGFTITPAGQRSMRRDHPRSRGVYVGDGVDDDAVRGSSPLARGLPEDHGRRQPRRRIIPARAGFTIPKPEEEDATTDHPRSRGVYPALTTRSVMDMGSSPLARGLQCRPGNTLEGGRIIPARAGFTGQGGHAAAFPWDHPRSRGVYEAWT